MNTLPNLLTLARIVLSLALLTVKPLTAVFLAIYLCCGVSDMLDGPIARRTGTVSDLGRRLDSLADLIMVTVLIWMLAPLLNLTLPIIGWIVGIAVIRLASLAVVLLKFHTVEILHTYANKLTGLVLFLFPIALIWVRVAWLVPFCCAVATVAAVEELAILLVSQQLPTERKSIFVK